MHVVKGQLSASLATRQLSQASPTIRAFATNTRERSYVNRPKTTCKSPGQKITKNRLAPWGPSPNPDKQNKTWATAS